MSGSGHYCTAGYRQNWLNAKVVVYLSKRSRIRSRSGVYFYTAVKMDIFHTNLQSSDVCIEVNMNLIYIYTNLYINIYIYVYIYIYISLSIYIDVYIDAGTKVASI